MTATFVPLSQRPNRPESSLEARAVATQAIVRIFGAEALDRQTVDRIARRVMIRWDHNTSLDIIDAIGEEVRCTECKGAGSYPGAFFQDCPICDGEGVALNG